MIENKFENGVLKYDVPRFPEGKSIPKIIHQTFPKKTLPPELQENVDNLKRLNSGWEHRLYDDDDIMNFVQEAYGPQMASYFDRIEPEYGVVKADLFRYLVVYKLGGVYLDIKSTSTKPLDDVLVPDDRYLICGWANDKGEDHDGFGLPPELSHVKGGEFQQWHVVAAPGHPFLRAVIETVLENIDTYKAWVSGTGVNGVLRLSGPIAYTLAIQPLLPLHPHRYARTNNDYSFKYSVLQTPHSKLFKKHYRTLTGSIVKMKGFDKILSDAYVFAKRVKRRYQDLAARHKSRA